MEDFKHLEKTKKTRKNNKIADSKAQDLLHPVLCCFFLGFKSCFDFAGTPYFGHVDKQRFQQESFDRAKIYFSICSLNFRSSNTYLFINTSFYTH